MQPLSRLRRPALKVCGLTRPEDVRVCLDLGVRFLGVNRYAPSPRCVPAERVPGLLAMIPVGARVYVDVDPGLPELHGAKEAGFDIFQIHFDPARTEESRVRMWRDSVGAARLWLAPRLAGGATMPAFLFEHAGTFLVDGYSPGAFGGTGKTADWAGVAALRSLHREKTWVVAGGLSPVNIVEAARASRADVLDLNSGVESAPGVKDAALLAAAVARLNDEL